jgi:cytochrome b561
MSERYTRTAQALHWLMAALLVGLVSLGLYMHELPLSPQKLQLYSYHKWAGVTAFVLVLVRLAWRATHRPPALPQGTSSAVRAAASAGHALLYLLMISIPLSGWLMSSAKGFQTVWFGVLPIPDLVGKDAALGETLRAVHEYLNLTLIVVALGHVAAALKHQCIDRDGLLHRMWPGRAGATGTSPTEHRS